MDDQSGTLPSLSLNVLVEKELSKIQKQPMSSRKVSDLYALYKTLEFVQRLRVVTKEEILAEKKKVFEVIEVSIVTEYTE